MVRSPILKAREIVNLKNEDTFTDEMRRRFILRMGGYISSDDVYFVALSFANEIGARTARTIAEKVSEMMPYHGFTDSDIQAEVRKLA